MLALQRSYRASPSRLVSKPAKRRAIEEKVKSYFLFCQRKNSLVSTLKSIAYGFKKLISFFLFLSFLFHYLIKLNNGWSNRSRLVKQMSRRLQHPRRNPFRRDCLQIMDRNIAGGPIFVHARIELIWSSREISLEFVHTNVLLSHHDLLEFLSPVGCTRPHIDLGLRRVFLATGYKPQLI